MINIDEIYSIDVDKYNYILIKDEKRLNKKGEMVFKTIGYYPSLESAISACAEQYERDAFSENELSLREAVEFIRQTRDRFANLLKRALNGD